MLLHIEDIYQYINNKIKVFFNSSERQKITQIILEKKIKCTTFQILTNAQVEIDDLSIFDDIIFRLEKNEPIQYIFNSVFFCDLDLYVDKNVLIPRQETEELVRDIFNTKKQYKNILDLCTGSGCIAIVLKKKYPKANVLAIDISQKALNVAQKNAKKYNLNIKFIKQDILSNSIFDILKNLKFDLIVSNPPYVCYSEKKNMMKRVLEYEPHKALFVPDSNPLIFYKRINDILLHNLSNDGDAFLEINEQFGNEISKLFSLNNYLKNEIKKDINEKNRWVYLKKIC